MISATVFCDTCQPSSHKSSVILGEPYVRPERSKKQRIRSASTARLVSRFVGSDGLRRHL
ncbi:hypothetical protein [Streptomyces sp. SID12488]|uniref:hypothetical protein n=1 Tax=Streptomyces sp. SID12488 TaxID=2706040 RepID=UPI001EF2CAC4|nr:hypothetical protein [Streptomyces sp. SID12488]